MTADEGQSNGRGGVRSGAGRKAKTFHLDDKAATDLHDLLKFKRRVLHKPDFSVSEQVRLWVKDEWEAIEASYGAKEAQEPYIL